MFKHCECLSLPQCSLSCILWSSVTLTPLSTLSKYKSLSCPPLGKIYTPFTELSTVFCYNLKYIYRYFYTLHPFSFSVSMWSLAVTKHFRTTQILNGRFRGGKKSNNGLTVKWMLFQTDQKRYNLQLYLFVWLKDCDRLETRRF